MTHSGLLALAFLTIAGTVPAGNVVPLYGYYLLLLLPVTLAAAGAVIALALLAAVAAGGTWQYYSVNAAQRLVPPPAAAQIDVWEVVNVEQSVILNGRILVASTKMSLKNITGATHSSVELSLNPGLLVTEATVDGEAVSSRRAGELIRLEELPSPAPADEGIVLELRYTGIPVLLREDYKPASSITGSNPASFRKERVSFVSERALQWMRDSDWLAWPLSSGPHVAGNAHKLHISFNNRDGPVLTSGAVIAQDSGVDIYTWDKPPQFLLASGGVYRHDSSAEGDTWVGRLSTEQTAAGRVWTFTTVDRAVQEQEDLRVVAITHTEQGTHYRVLAEERPTADAAPASPTVEDAYLWLIRSRNR